MLAPVDVCPASGEGFENELIAGKDRERKKWMTTRPSDHGGSMGIKGVNDTCLGDTDRLLFHGFVPSLGAMRCFFMYLNTFNVSAVLPLRSKQSVKQPPQVTVLGKTPKWGIT